MPNGENALLRVSVLSVVDILSLVAAYGALWSSCASWWPNSLCLPLYGAILPAVLSFSLFLLDHNPELRDTHTKILTSNITYFTYNIRYFVN